MATARSVDLMRENAAAYEASEEPRILGPERLWCLSDPRKTSPDRLRTLLRRPLQSGPATRP